jgi:hypothetical protein
MKLPRDLSGEGLVAHLSKHWAYSRIHQEGSHIILQTQSPFPHRIAVPTHKFLRVGTLNAILTSIAAHKGVPKEDILKDI